MKTVLEIDKEFEGADLYVFSSSQLAAFVDLREENTRLHRELNDLYFAEGRKRKEAEVMQRVVSLELNANRDRVDALLSSARVPNPHPRYQTESKTT